MSNKQTRRQRRSPTKQWWVASREDPRKGRVAEGRGWKRNPLRPYCAKCDLKLGMLDTSCPLCGMPVGKRQRTLLLAFLLILAFGYIVLYTAAY